AGARAGGGRRRRAPRGRPGRHCRGRRARRSNRTGDPCGRRAWIASRVMATRSDWLDARRADLWARDTFRFIPGVALPAPPAGTTARPGEGPRVAFCGFPSDYSLAFLLGLLELEVRPVAVITSPGAHPVIAGTNALSQIADHLGIPLLRHWRVNDE